MKTMTRSLSHPVERWLPVVGYEGLYEVSSEGRVRSLDRVSVNRWGSYRRNGRILKPSAGRRGYLNIKLYKHEEKKTFLVHRLVARSFIGPVPPEEEVRHLNGVNTDNRQQNLAYGTAEDNRQDDIKNLGRHKNARLLARQVKDIADRIRRGESNKSIAADYSVGYENIGCIRNGVSWSWLTGFLLLIVLALPAFGETCTTCSPAKPAPASLWGTLEARALLGDNTKYLHDHQPTCSGPWTAPMWFDAAIEGRYLWTVTGSGLEGWDRINPDRPVLVSKLCEPTLNVWRASDKDYYLTSVDGIGDRVVVGSEGGMGVLVFDTADPRQPKLIWQWEGECAGCLSVRDVTMTTIDGRRYAFAVDDSLLVWAFSLDPPAALGRVPGGATQMFLQSVWKIDSAGPLLVLRWAGKSQVWSVGDLDTPVLVAQTGPNPLDVAIWQQDGHTYTASAHGSTVNLYSLVNGSLVLLETYSTPDSVVETLRMSQDAGHTYLYAGSTRPGNREWLWDVTDVSRPIEYGSAGYWGWYAAFRNVAPYAGLVRDGRLYRAAWSVFDVHRLALPVGPPPPLLKDGFESGGFGSWEVAQ